MVLSTTLPPIYLSSDRYLLTSPGLAPLYRHSRDRRKNEVYVKVYIEDISRGYFMYQWLEF
jgi:hypothetical protein